MQRSISSALRALRVGALTGALFASAGPAVAQRISGTIREAGGGPLISGGFVSLIDEAGQALQADFTAADGAFTLVAPAPGRYRVRVERIGYANWTTDPYGLSAGQLEVVQIEIPPQPVLLADLRVEVTRSCLDDPTQGTELAQVWEEARKALETAVWAEQRGEVTFTLTEYHRTLEPGSLATREAESRTRHRVRLPPFESVPVSRLADRGYAIVTRDTSTYYAPDAAVLLSQEFQDTHCFGLRRAKLDESSMLGITFSPRNARAVVEVEGTLWLDEATAHLERVQLIYRNVPLPRGADRRLVGADLVFDRLPDGPFYVSEWWIRFPVVGRVSRLGRSTLNERSSSVLVAYKQTGGAVTDVYVGDTAIEAGEGAVTGIVRDSVSGAPLAGAEVVVRDWDDAADFLPTPDPANAPFSAVTDDAGAFVVPGLPDGIFAIRVDHPKLRAAGVRLTETRITVDDRRSEPLDLWTPSAETIYARICPGAALDKARGAVVGLVRDSATGLVLADVEVEALWRLRRITVTSTGEPQLSDLSEGTGDTSDEHGRFVLCDVPSGETIRLRPRGERDAVTFELDERVVWRDVSVGR